MTGTNRWQRLENHRVSQERETDLIQYERPNPKGRLLFPIPTPEEEWDRKSALWLAERALEREARVRSAVRADHRRPAVNREEQAIEAAERAHYENPTSEDLLHPHAARLRSGFDPSAHTLTDAHRRPGWRPSEPTVAGGLPSLGKRR